MTSLINQLFAYEQPVLLTLDDFHEIEEPSIHEAIYLLLDNQPPNFHLVITSRTEPPLPLARMRVRREVTEINTEELRFSRDESADFLNQHMQLNLSGEDIAQLDSVTEGWVASIQLAGLSLQNKDDPTEFIQTFTGDNRYIVEYLVTEVLQRQPGYIRDFLLQTSILQRLNVQLCNAVTGQVGSQHILETLDQARLFVIPLDDRRHWYCYHHLFADCLRAELLHTAPDTVSTYHERASRWLSEQGDFAEAIHHGFAANNPALVADLIAANARTLLWEEGETHRSWQWIQQLPDEEVLNRPQLLISKAWLYQELFMEHGPRVTALLDAARTLIKAADAPYPPPEIANMATEIALAHSNLERLQGNLDQALRHSTDALPLIQAGDSAILKTSVHHSLALTHHQLGNVIESLTHSEARFSTAHAEGSLDYSHYVSLAYRIDALRLAGKLQQAALAFQQVERHYSRHQHGGAAMLVISWTEVLRERNDLNQAIDLLMPAIERIKSDPSMAVVVQTGTITLARIYQAQGQGHQGLSLLQETLKDFPAPDTYYPAARISAMVALLHLQQGNIAAARAWTDASCLTADDLPAYLLEVDYLVLARVLIADGNAHAAQHLLAKLEGTTKNGGRLLRLMEVHILQALAHQAMGENDQALSRLSRSIELAAPAGFVRLFVDEGNAVEMEASGIFRALGPILSGRFASTFGLVQEELKTYVETGLAAQ